MSQKIDWAKYLAEAEKKITTKVRNKNYVLTLTNAGCFRLVQ